jgi:hypothetical protein
MVQEFRAEAGVVTACQILVAIATRGPGQGEDQ